MAKQITADAWIIIEPQRSGYSGAIVGLELARMLKNKPRVGVREVAVHITFEVDSDIFQTPEPHVTVRIDDKRALVVPEIDVELQPEPQEGSDAAGLDESAAAEA